jgi:hypothetical protein
MLFVCRLFLYNGVEKMATWVYLVLLLLALLYMLFDSSYNGMEGRKAMSVYTTRLSLCCRYNQIL